MAKTPQQIKKALVNDEPRVAPIPDDSWLSLGCTLLNLALSNGRPDGALAMGHCLWYVGASSSGKTWGAAQALAEAVRNPNFDAHRLIFDNVENGQMFDIAHYFGAKLADRLEPPRGTRADPQYSVVAEDLYDTIWDLGKAGDPFIYVVDSMDALRDSAGDAKYEEQKDARDKGKDVTGTFGMSKAKVNSDQIKRVKTVLRDTRSILIMLSQERDKVNSPFPQKTTSGGHALRFYATAQIWCTIKGDLARDVMGKKREYGKIIQVSVEKNQVSGWEGKIIVPFLRNYGLDDVGASVDYLCDEDYWAKDKKSGIVTADDFKFKGRREDLIKLIQEKDGGEQKLANLAAFLWRKIDEATRIKRKPRYE